MNDLSEFPFLRIPHGGEQYAQAVALRRRHLRVPLGLEFSKEDLEAEVDQWHFGLFSDDGIVASVTIVPLPQASKVKLRQMVVDEHLHGRGLGRHLLLQVENSLARQHVEQIELSARLPAVPFYEKLGYQVEGKPFIEVTIEHLKMRKSLLK